MNLIIYCVGFCLFSDNKQENYCLERQMYNISAQYHVGLFFVIGRNRKRP